MKKNSKREVSDCVVCSLSPLFKFAYYSGITTIQHKCIHSVQWSKKQEFSVSDCHRWVKSIMMLVMILDVAYAIFVVISQEHNKEFKLQILIDLIFCCTAIIINLGQIFQGHLRSQYLNCWVNLVEHRQKYGLKTLLTSRNIKNLRIHGILNLIVSTTLVVFGFIYDLAAACKNSVCVLHSFVIGLSTFIYLFNILQITVEMDMAYCILKTWQNQLVKKLNEKLKECKLNVRRPIENQIENYRRAYGAIIYSFNNVTTYLNPSVLLWVILILLLLITNFYLLLTIWSNTVKGEILFIQQFRSQCAILVLLNIVLYIGRFSDWSHSISSYLYKYPISKLTKEEALQVENLASAIIIQKPLLIASDMFLVDIKLLASISTTVFTYGLIGMQLHLMWKKTDKK